MIDISKAFDTSNRTLIQVFQEPGLGFYVPLYQREYSWDRENIDQLMEDICQGVENILTDTQEIRFLGTIIRVKENNPRGNINPQDTKAFPTRIDNIIDGQQRISSIAMLGALLFQRLTYLGKKLPNSSPYDVVNKEILPAKLNSVYELFSVDLQRGIPNRKPIIIRGSADTWTLDGEDEANYTSDVSSFLASVIRSIHEKTQFLSLPTGNQVGDNLRIMSKWLDDVEEAHCSVATGAMNFPTAWEIIDNSDLEVAIWTYERDELSQIVKDQANDSKQRDALCRVVQMLAFTHYLLDRCCFNVIDPVSDNWAFDMFQSLNATGTPLTSLETFRPMVVNRTNSEGNGGYKNSKSAIYFEEINTLFSNERSAAQKAKLTNEYLTTFAHTLDGTKLPQRFSSQRRWLNDLYGACNTPLEREDCIRKMANIATYLGNVMRFDHTKTLTLPGLETASPESRELATLCVLYLNDAGHKMAHTVLSLFYARILRSYPEAVNEFIEACKATAAFYTLWRSAYSNSGLDNAYRQILKGNKEQKIEPISWQSSTFSSNNLKKYYREILDSEKRQIGKKDDWMKRAITNLRFDTIKPVCRFSLILVSQNSVPDEDHLGLMKLGKKGSTPNYLTPSMWYNKDLKTLEHIAPQKRPDGSTWDDKLYELDRYQRIGNLTLLPIEINSSASNRDWKAKCIYYMHLAEKDLTKLKDLELKAHAANVELNQDTLAMLRDANYSEQIASIVSVGIDGKWNAEAVESRTERISSLIWDNLFAWLA